MAEVAHSGFLSKKGPHFNASFKRRYFELRHKTIFYYADINTNKPPKGQINLHNASVDDSQVAKLRFKITTTQRTYELKADTVTDYERWVGHIRRAINYNPAQDNDSADQMRKEISNSRTSSRMVYQNTTSKRKPTLDDFEVLVVLGRGSFGKVMKVRDRETGRIYAMKSIKKALVTEANFVESTKNENIILRTISHPFIAKLHFAFQTDDKLFLVLDFLSGGELFFHLQQEKRFPVEKARFYIAEMLLGIEHLHKNGIIYRDLKPENVVLDSKGHATLTDFGLSKTSVEDNQITYSFCGTPEYLAPEICRGDGHNKAADYWSLGIVSYALMTGSVPFYSSNIMQQYQYIMKENVRYPEYLPQSAKSFIAGLLDRDPNTRYNADDCKVHPFFEGIDWVKLEKRELTPPFVPETTEDERYFDEGFTGEDIHAVSDDEEDESTGEQPKFVGFTYDGSAENHLLQ